MQARLESALVSSQFLGLEFIAQVNPRAEIGHALVDCNRTEFHFERAVSAAQSCGASRPNCHGGHANAPELVSSKTVSART